MLDGIAFELLSHEDLRAALESRPIFFGVIAAAYFTAAISARISSIFQALVLGDSFTGFGKRPDLHPAHQADFDTG